MDFSIKDLSLVSLGGTIVGLLRKFPSYFLSLMFDLTSGQVRPEYQNVNTSSITVQPPLSGRSGPCLCWQLCILLAAGVNSGGPQVGEFNKQNLSTSYFVCADY